MSRDRPIGLIGEPSARASRFYRVLLLGVRALGRGVFGFRTEVLGAELLPRDASGSPSGGWIAAGLPHRTWVDPFIVADNLPFEPRLAYFGDGPAIHRSRWRRVIFRRIGGVIPIWPGGGRDAVDAHLAAVSQALAAGCVLCLFPETGPATPPGTARPFGLGVAYFALRTGAPIVPIVLGGSLLLGALYETGYIWKLSAPLAPVMEGWLGLPAVAGLTLIFAVLRKELALQLLVTLAVVRYGPSAKNLLHFMTAPQLFVYALVNTIYIPCVATIAVLGRELGWRRSAAIMCFTIAVALLIGGVAYRVLLAFGVH